jgi:hypothetical protein
MTRFIILLFIFSSVALAVFYIPSLSRIFENFSGVAKLEKKCTTQAGKVYYGHIPDGIVCKKTESVDTSITVIKSQPQDVVESSMNYGNMKCDGRRYCSQMKSCKEATFFIKNCPNTSMDGNSDGIPCQKQWCKF